MLPLAKMLKIWEPVEEATTKIGVVVLLSKFVPWITNKAVGVEELKPNLELALTVRMEVPEEEAMLKMSDVPVLPWRLKVTVEEEALTPKTVPLFMSLPVVKAVALVQMASKPTVPEPVTLPLLQEVTYKAPLEVAATQPAVPRELRVVEPLAATVNSWELVEEATTKIGVVVLPSLLVPWTVRIAVGVEEFMATLVLALTVSTDCP
jgi:hypothetical protein